MKKRKHNKKIDSLRLKRLAIFLDVSTYKTAQNRLSRMILFDLIVKLKKDICYVCKYGIIDYTDFSIEHIKPWESRNPLLFWDMENITFSHKWCNKPHRGISSYKANILKQKRIISPVGKNWCRVCKQFLLKDRFWKRKASWHGLGGECKKCHNDRKSKKTIEKIL